jgi:hypothetical protein
MPTENEILTASIRYRKICASYGRKLLSFQQTGEMLKNGKKIEI